jgi:hypothetical protein
MLLTNSLSIRDGYISAHESGMKWNAELAEHAKKTSAISADFTFYLSWLPFELHRLAIPARQTQAGIHLGHLQSPRSASP